MLMDDIDLIAPCGLNCGLCYAFVRDRNPCPGCRGRGKHKSKSCLACAICNCSELAAGHYQFCSACAKYPCADLLRLDRRYRVRYGVSAIANLARIGAVGVTHFVAEESSKWLCPECGSRLCVHEPQCANCGHVWRRE